MLRDSVGLFALLESMFKRMSCGPSFVDLVGSKALMFGNIRTIATRSVRDSIETNFSITVANLSAKKANY